jgi:hypothetical protein
MKISVAMCTFNGERYLREQLESLTSQTRHPDEAGRYHRMEMALAAPSRICLIKFQHGNRVICHHR